MSTTLKQKMAGRLAGSLKSTQDRLDKADAVMLAGGLLKPKASADEVPERATSSPKRPAAHDRDRAKDNGAGRASNARKVDSAADDPKKHRQSVSESVETGVTKIRVQRETFTMLPNENEKINEVRTRAAANKFFTNRSAVIRAGVMALERMNDEQLVQMLGRLPVIKPGRG